MKKCYCLCDSLRQFVSGERGTTKRSLRAKDLQNGSLKPLIYVEVELPEPRGNPAEARYIDPFLGRCVSYCMPGTLSPK
jgi:hypothetical protein